MSEQHSGIPHDLPEYAPNDPPKWRVQLYRGPWGWSWGHQCDAITHRQGDTYLTWRIALKYADEHARRCL